MRVFVQIRKIVSNGSSVKMRLVLLTHPASLVSESMPRFAGMIARMMANRGHEVEVWTSPQRIGRFSIQSPFVRKWLGYADQFLFYPRELRRRVNRQPSDTLFIVADHALGMWVPHLARRPHVIHCHDFIALKSALGEFPEHATRWSGRRYQHLIRQGFSHGKAFISVSKNTRADLHRYLPEAPPISEVVHNALNHPFRPMERAESIPLLETAGIKIPDQGFIIHVGGNQWYKNRMGVLEIYRSYVAACPRPPALWMIGAKPADELLKLAASIPNPGRVEFVSGLSNEQVNAAYSQARVLLFPSMEEGFGWPIAEAMAAGCPVVTTDAPPMTEVADGAARLIPRMPQSLAERETWAKSATAVLDEVVGFDEIDRARQLQLGRLNALRFDEAPVFEAYEQIYRRALKQNGN